MLAKTKPHLRVDRTFRQNLRPQARAVRERADYRLTGERLQVAAGLAQADARTAHGADLKLASHERNERNPAGHEVATNIAWNEVEAMFKARRLHRLGLDQSEFEIPLRLEKGPCRSA